MKPKIKVIISILSIGAIMSAGCSSNSSDSKMAKTDIINQEDKPNGQRTDTLSAITGNSSLTNGFSKAKDMIQQMDCAGCHKEHEKLVGPAYIDIAKKYDPNNETVNKLAKKIISGGKGAWGELAMTPHPNLSMEDARALVKYILSMK